MRSTDEAPTRSKFLSIRWGCLLPLVIVPFFFLLMMAGIGTGLLDLSISLLFGWINFLGDIWPRIAWNWSAICFGILCVCLILVLGQWFLNWLSRSIAIARGKRF